MQHARASIALQRSSLPASVMVRQQVDRQVGHRPARINTSLLPLLAGTYSAKGFPRSMYDMSKVLENAYTKVVARECKAYTNMEVNAVCPG